MCDHAPMIVIASANGSVGIDAAWDVLAGGGTSLDAVEAGTRAVEDNPDDHTVGYGGYPNLLGQVGLDASIMDGATRRGGAVGGLRRTRAAISVARAVLERLPHGRVVGQGAGRLAGAPGPTACSPARPRTPGRRACRGRSTRQRSAAGCCRWSRRSPPIPSGPRAR